MSAKLLMFLILFTAPLCRLFAQEKVADSFIASSSTSIKYLRTASAKTQQYANRVSGKTVKVLNRLSKWESKIKKILEKASPATASRLFANPSMTFSGLLDKVKKGELLVNDYSSTYNNYLDKVNTSFKYFSSLDTLANSNVVANARKAVAKSEHLENEIAESDYVQEFIRERKNALINESIKHIGKSKYLKKMNKEAYYFAESLANYKELFSDPKKIEDFVLKALRSNKDFRNFFQQNSSLPGSSGLQGISIAPGVNIPIVNGIALRASLLQFTQNNAPMLNAASLQQTIQSKMPSTPSELDHFYSKISGKGKMGNNNLPEFTPNSQRSKTFFQRLEYGADVQFGKTVSMLPGTANIALKLGYKINDKSTAGIGLSYIAGLGEGWNKIKITHQGLGLRSYLKWELKKKLHIQGGSEWNYMSQFKNLEALKNKSPWQQAALIGFSKEVSEGKKMKANVQLLYDFLHSTQIPVKQPFVFRMGYDF